jgi:hypothetical protein
MDDRPDDQAPGAGARTPEMKVVDRRWWARGASAETAETPAGKPTYVEELEARLAEKDRVLQDYIRQYKAAAGEFEESRARARRDVAKEVERGKRAILVDLLEVVDNLDRAIESAKEARTVDVLVHGSKWCASSSCNASKVSVSTRSSHCTSPLTPRSMKPLRWCPRRDRRTTRKCLA